MIDVTLAEHFPKHSEDMARLELHKLSTRLCRLFDGGYTDVKTFARLSGESPRTIEWVTNHPGARIDRETEFNISKTLAAFVRKYPEIHWDIEPPAERKRVVIEEETHRADERRFSAYDAEGNWRLTALLPADDVDEEAIDAIYRYLDRKSPRPALKVINGDHARRLRSLAFFLLTSAAVTGFPGFFTT